VLPLDPFTKTLTGEVTYTYHLSDQLAWEMFRAFYADSFKTSIRQQAEQDYGVAPSTFEEYRFGVSSSLEVAPAYGKFSLMNDNVLHAELLLAVGPMVAWMEQNNVAQIKVGPIGGIGLRLFANDTLSVRLDTRYGVLFGTRKPSTTTLICTVALGVSFDFGHAD
jgi:outer membrane beta-barrel protein